MEVFMRTTASLSDEQKDRIADLASGFALGFEQAQREFELTDEELRELLLDMNIEQCPDCRWWVESHELIAPDADGVTPDGHCNNCRPRAVE